ncbi:hypothetical protein FOZ61_004967 [Perkinsus olseni]|uniref:Uncharacterized protein n=1 Tax=Perkinsus olseni TaxID=32597 RepID=A0A7J6MDQ9_PEROL|nr:hypothetical protein FOZ61_004967 [Perkinsus olseni]
MGSCCSRGNPITELVDASSPVENPYPGRTEKRRRRLSINQGSAGVVDAASSSDTEIDEDSKQGRIVTGGGSSFRSARRLSITSRPVEGKRPHQRGFADKNCDKQGGKIPETLGYACKKGLKPDSPNQDDFAIFIMDNWQMYAVFDGHGPYGHVVSKFCQDTLPELITDDPNFQDHLSKTFKTSFIRTHVLCEQTADSQGTFDCSFSGSTATIVVRRNGFLNCAWVGDSRAVLATIRTPDKGHGPTRLVAVDLSRDHKPELPEERARIEAQGGRVLKLGGDIPYRVFVKTAYYPGLAMTRSIGDTVGVSAGISHVPEVSVRPVNEGVDKFILVASDGVWEFISSQEAVDIINKYPPTRAQAAAEALAHEAWLRWMREERGKLAEWIILDFASEAFGGVQRRVAYLSSAEGGVGTSRQAAPPHSMVTAAPTQAKSQGHRSSGGEGTQRKKDTGEASLAASRARMLRVTNLTRNVDEEHLNEIFGTYARVESVHLAVDEENHLSKGYAYVLFATREGAEEAFFHVDRGQIDGNVVKVVFVAPPSPPVEKAPPRKAAVPSGTNSVGDRSRSPPKHSRDIQGHHSR